MLKYLHIENIAVIENANIEPTETFNVLTGETGAGKSIIIDSLNAVLGERTSKELIRNGENKATVSAIFCGLSEDTLKVIRENGFDVDEDGNLSIQRVLSLTGNGSIKINGVQTTSAVLREVGKYLVNIHGQHDNQMLLKPENHYIYIDLLADNLPLREEYYSCFKNFNDIRREIKSLELDEDKKLERIDLLKYQISELESAQIKLGELETLKASQKLLQNREKIMKTLRECVSSLLGDDDTNGAITLSQIALKTVDKLKDESLDDISSSLNNAIELLNTAAEKASDNISELLSGEENLENINDRLDLLQRLMLKYGNDEESLLSFLDKAKSELENIEFSEERLAQLEEALLDAEQKLIKAGEKLTKSRKLAAKTFTNGVCEALRLMDMASVEFLVKIDKGKYTKNGCDEIEFFISANAGESIKPLYKVASGGELSRTMLAIKSVISSKDNVETLIFDEIDSGISGRAALKVAKQLKEVAKTRQVICVTHLAQIASFADTHFLIEKSVSNNRTFTNVIPLDYEKRVNEIARIMSGTELTENTMKSAKELLDRSK
ncbi:MAG: DNA repair protein RecN [Clostridia bacterium]|nr:DNA repair protein RecN [Clostridia bacterium]